MPSSDEKRLLKEVLQDAHYAEFRAELYKQSLAEFKEGNQRPTREVLLAVAAVALIAAAIVLTLSSDRKLRSSQDASRTSLPSAAALPIATVESFPLDPADMVRSLKDQSLLTETQSAGAFAVPYVHSQADTLKEMKDSELLAFFSNDALGFVRTGTGQSLFYITHPQTR